MNNKPQYIKAFELNLKEVLKINKKLKVAGFCFGHQLIAQIFGAKIEKRTLKTGTECIVGKSHDLGKIDYLSKLSNGEDFKVKLYEYHSDYIVNVPKGLRCIGTS